MESGFRTSCRLRLRDEAATRALGATIARNLIPGLPVLLNGDLGTGKSVLARAVLRAVMDDPELDVPSPTFTLVQTYEGPEFDLWHVDLYRIENPEDVIELGLEDAMADVACLIEWPDRLGAFVPRHALQITLLHGTEGEEQSRIVDISWGVNSRQGGIWAEAFESLARDADGIDLMEDDT